MAVGPSVWVPQGEDDGQATRNTQQGLEGKLCRPKLLRVEGYLQHTLVKAVETTCMTTSNPETSPGAGIHVPMSTLIP